ncbi:MAG: phosphoethanolamine transferase [Piscinibacter sp.]|uniref:phosphoethanolamine transferase n=1 Tax=Piscinibacter sp. TaxID=1903157 RepID=UPI003D0C33C1
MTSSTQPLPSLEPGPWRLAQAAPIALVLTLGLFIVLGHDGRRTVQMLALTLPLIVWSAWPLRSDWLHRVRTLSIWSLAMAFVLDGAVRHYLWAHYQAAPDSSMVLGALANSRAQESSEYLRTNAPGVLWRLLPALVAAAVLAWALGRAPRWPRAASAWRPPRRLVLAVLAAVLLVAGVAHASKPWRRMHPAVFWSQWWDSAQQLRAGWAQQLRLRERTLAQAREQAPTLAFGGPATVMLVVGESVNRDNLGLYGYPRDTTPRLAADRARLGEQFAVLRHAWSADASTLPALHNLFRFGQGERSDAPHLIALARAAGYKVWWIGNQDDMALEALHAGLSDQVEMINRRPGRGGDTLDGELLDEVGRALADPSPRKLLVVHLMGAHPHYALRCPPGANPFENADDAVDRQLQAAGRSAWTREARNDYDAALRYHDSVLSDLLKSLREAAPAGGRAAWMYFSDHGQEVGHELDRAGHSATTASGYRIPALIWRSELIDAATATRPFRADWAAWTVADLLGLQWAGRDDSRNVLSGEYRWQAPRLGVAVAHFDR